MGTPSLSISKAIVVASCLLSLTLSAFALVPTSPQGEQAVPSPEVAEGSPVTVSEDERVDEIQSTVAGFFDFDPDVLNLKSGGKYVTGYLELPEGYPVREVFVPSVKLNNAVYAETCFGVQIVDSDNDGTDELMLKFIKADVKLVLSPGDCVTVAVAGVMNDGTAFAAEDVIVVTGQ